MVHDREEDKEEETNNDKMSEDEEEETKKEEVSEESEDKEEETKNGEVSEDKEEETKYEEVSEDEEEETKIEEVHFFQQCFHMASASCLPCVCSNYGHTYSEPFRAGFLPVFLEHTVQGRPARRWRAPSGA